MRGFRSQPIESSGQTAIGSKRWRKASHSTDDRERRRTRNVVVMQYATVHLPSPPLRRSTAWIDSQPADLIGEYYTRGYHLHIYCTL
jgi:Ni/Co efflux regulator RcnB